MVSIATGVVVTAQSSTGAWAAALKAKEYVKEEEKNSMTNQCIILNF
jgi:hypothetical protein